MKPKLILEIEDAGRRHDLRPWLCFATAGHKCYRSILSLIYWEIWNQEVRQKQLVVLLDKRRMVSMDLELDQEVRQEMLEPFVVPLDYIWMGLLELELLISHCLMVDLEGNLKVVTVLYSYHDFQSFEGCTVELAEEETEFFSFKVSYI